MTAAMIEPQTTPGGGSRQQGPSGRWTSVQGLLAKELRGRMRGPRAFVVLSVYLLFLTGFTLLIYYLVKLANSSSPTTPAGKIVFLGLVAFELGLVCFLAPSFTAGAISGERERQTYDLLMTTPAPLVLIVASKLFAALAYVFLLIVAALPLMSIALFLGGVAPEEIAIAFVMLCASALVFGAVGLCFSAWLRSTIGAAALAYAAMLLPVVALPIVAGAAATLIGAIVANSNNAVGLVIAYYVAGFLASLNPFIAGGLTEAIIASNKSLFFYSTTGPSGMGTVYVVGPWLIYTVMALLTSVGCFLLSVYLARPTRVARRRKSPAA